MKSISYIDKDMQQKVLDWAIERNLINGSDPRAQTLKLASEISEMGLAVAIGDMDKIADGIGDSVVCLIILAAQLGADADDLAMRDLLYLMLPPAFGTQPYIVIGQLCDAVLKGDQEGAKGEIGCLIVSLREYGARIGIDLNDGLRRAYNEIKDRKGIMFNGVFIKQDDPQFEVAVAKVQAAKEVA